MAVPCFHSASRLVLMKMTALYVLFAGVPKPANALPKASTSSVQSTATPTSPIHLMIAFCATFAAVSGGSWSRCGGASDYGQRKGAGDKRQAHGFSLHFILLRF